MELNAGNKHYVSIKNGIAGSYDDAQEKEEFWNLFSYDVRVGWLLPADYSWPGKIQNLQVLPRPRQPVSRFALPEKITRGDHAGNKYTKQ